MKPPPFVYLQPNTLQQAIELLSTHVETGKIIAGGQSLVPIMNFRLAAPEQIIDINRITELSHIERTSTELRLGALVRWCELEQSPLVGRENPLLQEAIRHVAHYQIRNRGTLGGSCAHADPAAEFPAVALACDASFIIRSQRGERILRAREFFLGALTTALASDEILTEVRFPLWPPHRRWAFQEFSRRQGDFALAAAIVMLDMDSDGMCENAILVSFGVSDQATRLDAAEHSLAGHHVLTHERLAQAADLGADESDPKSDVNAPADYRKALLRELLYRALCMAAKIAEDGAVQ